MRATREATLIIKVNMKGNISKTFILLLLYVDDILIANNDYEEIESLKLDIS
jgi:hypothetical protein